MDDVEKVKQKIDIVDLISDYITTKKAGRNFKANCPFHNEKTPSFVISPDRQIWHCFGCNKGGDHFTFLEEYEHIDFSESLKMLAEKAGIKLTTSSFRSEGEQKKAGLYALNHLAAQFYNYLLTKHPAGKKALSYVKDKRHVSDKLITTFMLGFAPNDGVSLSNYLTKKKDYKSQDLVEAGLAFYRGGRLVDFFYNRLIFSIYDQRNNVIGFSARSLDEGLPKYINTKETRVYTKGDTLFGINNAKEAIRKTGKAIIMEGEFDVISSFREGISHAVAVKGSALTLNQIKLLKRYTQKIIFSFDTDPAGTDAQKRSIELIGKENITAAVIIPPKGKDPDEILNTDPALFKKALKKEVNIYDFIIDSALKSRDPKNIEEKQLILDETLPFLEAIENAVVKEHYMKRLSSVLDSSLESVLKQAEKITSPAPILQKKVQKKVQSREELLESYLLALILQSKTPKETFDLVKTVLSTIKLGSEVKERLLEQLDQYFQKHNDFDVSSFTKALSQELHSTFDLCYLAPLPVLPTKSVFQNEVKKTANDIKILTLKKKLKDVSLKIKKEESSNNQDSLLKLQREFDKITSMLSA